MKLKLLESEDIAVLEEMVNDWLQEKGSSIVPQSYSASVATSGEGHYKWTAYMAQIWYVDAK